MCGPFSPLVPLSARTVAPSFFDADPPKPTVNIASSSTAASSAVASCRWYYLDKTDREFGPYHENEMRSWYLSGALPPHLRVRQLGELPEDKFTPIKDRECAFTKPLATNPSATTNGGQQQQPQPLLMQPQMQPSYYNMQQGYPAAAASAGGGGSYAARDYRQTFAYSNRGRQHVAGSAHYAVDATASMQHSCDPNDRILHHYMDKQAMDRMHENANHPGGRGGPAHHQQTWHRGGGGAGRGRGF